MLREANIPFFEREILRHPIDKIFKRYHKPIHVPPLLRCGNFEVVGLLFNHLFLVVNKRCSYICARLLFYNQPLVQLPIFILQ